MQKEEIVSALKEMADLLEITDANRFEYLAFRNAAAGLDDWQGDLAAAAKSSTLTDIPAVGKGIAKVISDLVESGESTELARVRGLVPDDLPLLLRFRGLGPKRVRTLWSELKIESPVDLKKEIEAGNIQRLKGFGAKTVEKMLDSIEYFENNAATEKPLPKLDKVPKAIASTGKIFAGTSGYSYSGWKDSFYPADAKTAELLQHYSTKLLTVEINNTFYRFPSEKVVEQWKAQTPDNFQFAFKVHRRVTHQMRLSPATKIRIQEFVDRCSVLGSRLGCILFQLPPDFERDDDRLTTLLESIPTGPRYAVEFRHESWNVKDVLDRLANHNVACVSGDAEDQSPLQFATADFVYARLRKPVYKSAELDKWNEWFLKQQTEKKDVLLYLKHDESGEVPGIAVSRWGES